MRPNVPVSGRDSDPLHWHVTDTFGKPLHHFLNPGTLITAMDR